MVTRTRAGVEILEHNTDIVPKRVDGGSVYLDHCADLVYRSLRKDEHPECGLAVRKDADKCSLQHAIEFGSQGCKSPFIHTTASFETARDKYARRARPGTDRIAVIDLSRVPKPVPIDRNPDVDGTAAAFAHADEEVVIGGPVPEFAILDVLSFDDMGNERRIITDPQWLEHRSKRRRRWAAANTPKFKVAGISHHQDAVEQLSVDEEVFLNAEPDNQHDKNAISVTFKKNGKVLMLGYVPRDHQQSVQPCLTSGCAHGRVESIMKRSSWKIGAPTYLEFRNNCGSYRHKEELKRRGARWDATKKHWYVPAGYPLAPFSRWCTNSASSNQERHAAAGPTGVAISIDGGEGSPPPQVENSE